MTNKNITNYTIEGKGKNMILIHGLSDSLEYWEPLTQILKNEYNIIRYDLRGHGKTPLGNEEITIDQYVNDLDNLIKQLDIKETIIVGFSLGGLIAQQYTTKHPEKVTSLILMSTFNQCTPHITNIFENLKGAVHKSFEEFYDQILPMVLCPEMIKNNMKELETIKEYAKKNVNTVAIEKAIDAMITFDDTIEIHKPTLIISGKFDNLVPVDTQKKIHEKIENSEFVIIDNVKHNILVGNNVIRISNLIHNFLIKN